MSDADVPLILTLALDADSFAVLDGLRRKYFPPERNYLSAHVTLFHALPGEHLASIEGLLARESALQAPLPLLFGGVRSLGRGVAVDVQCRGLLSLRARLAAAWSRWLTPQDRQKIRPHVTVQNKVPAEEAKELYAYLMATWKPFAGTGTGLSLWEYRGGPWEPVSDYNFTSPPPAQVSP